MPLEQRIRELAMVLVCLVEERSGGDPLATLGEMITAEEFESLMGNFHLVGTAPMVNGGMLCWDKPNRMTNIEQFRPKYPVLYVHRGWTLPDRAPVWIWDYFIDVGGGLIVSTSVEKPSLRELRNEYDCPVIIDEE